MDLGLPVADGERVKLNDLEEGVYLLSNIGCGNDDYRYDLALHYSGGFGYWFCSLIGRRSEVVDCYGTPEPTEQVTKYFHCTQDQLRVRLAELGL